MVHISTFVLNFSCLTTSRSRAAASSDGNRTGDDFVLQHDTDDEEDEVEQEHEESQKLAHFPFASRDRDDDKEKHEEEEDDGAEQTVAAHLYWLEVVEDIVDKPWEWQTGGGEKKVITTFINKCIRLTALS